VVRQLSAPRGADYLGHYPGTLLDQLTPAMSPFVRLEVGRARVVPYASRMLGSFIHTYLEDQSMLTDYTDNRPVAVGRVEQDVDVDREAQRLRGSRAAEGGA